MEKQNKKHSVAAFIILIIVTLGIAAGTWWYLTMYLQNPDYKSLLKWKDKTSKEKSEIPSDFTSVELNKATVYYPKSWETPETEVTKENFREDSGPTKTFSGEQALFGDWEKTDYFISASVTDVESLSKDSSEYISEPLKLLKKVYDDKKLNPEDLLSLGNGGLIPTVNAAVIPFNPRYIENAGSTWRGYWYLANMGQQINASVNFVSVIYNKDENKVFTIRQRIVSTQSKALEKRLYNELLTDTSEGGYMNASTEIRNYMQSAYVKDSEVKNTVDNEALKVCEFIK